MQPIPAWPWTTRQQLLRPQVTHLVPKKKKHHHRQRFRKRVPGVASHRMSLPPPAHLLTLKARIWAETHPAMLLVIPQEERVLFGIIHSSGEAPTLCSLTAH